MESLVHEILRDRRLQALYQPILDMENGHIHGYEGLIRGPSDGMLHAPLQLLKAAGQAGLRREMEILCMTTVVTGFAIQRLDGKLFINLSPDPVCSPQTLLFLMQLLETHRISPSRVIIELTEDDSDADITEIGGCLLKYREHGLRFALDDLGEGYSSLRRWSEYRPHYVKIDKHFTSGINQDPVKLQFVRSLQQIAGNSGAKLIAEGIETRAEFTVMRENGISLGQGYFISRPGANPNGISLAALDTIKTSAGNGRSNAAFASQATKLLIKAPTISPTDDNETALAIFNANPDLHGLAVVENGQPIGLLNRFTLVGHFSRIYIHELHGRRKCTQFMDSAPLIVDKNTPVDELSKLVVRKGKSSFSDGFIITENGHYLGLGSGYDLMEVIMQLQIAAARYSNPLTLLPGNVPISNHIQYLLKDNTPFLAAYCDLDHFKPFNDTYGYDHGDKIILLVSDVIKHEVDVSLDFVGHIGGDDFFIVFRSPDWQERCDAILQKFQNLSPGMYLPDHLEEGGYFSEDRRGQTVFHPLPALSIGIVAIQPEHFQSHHEVARAATLAKKQAKKVSGNSLFIERRHAQMPAQLAPAEAC